MRVSHSELHVVCKKVFEGLGFPHGANEDAAFMVSWLELHGLEGLELVRSALLGLRAANHPSRLELLHEDSCSAVIDARGASALAAASTAIDMASALAAEAQIARVELRNCRDQLCATALAVRAADLRGECFELRWSGSDGARVFVARAPDSSYLHVRLLAATAIANDERLLVRCTRADSSEPSEPRPSSPLWTHEQGLAHRDRVLRQGIEIDPAFWRELTALARHVLVPASETSRIRGAGGETVDD